jgi:hypothetical protein
VSAVSDVTHIALALISTVGGIVSAWMARRSGAHATTSRAAATYIAKSLHPPSDSEAPPSIGQLDIIDDRRRR